MKGAYPPENHAYNGEQLARSDALEAEAERAFGNRSDAARWFYNIQRDLDGFDSPSRVAARSDADLVRVIAYLHGLGITPRPDPEPWMGKAKSRRR